jgi:transposase
VTPGGALGLGKLAEWLADGECERGRELKAAAAMAGRGAAVAQDGARRGRRTGFK